MTDFISREAAIKVIQDYGKGAISDGMTALDPVDDIVSLARAMEWLDAADVAPVRHGQWAEPDKFDLGFWLCSNCGFLSEAVAANRMYNYCPSCGAKMGGEKANETD